MKRFFSFFLLIVLSFSLVACGNQEAGSDEAVPQSSVQEQDDIVTMSGEYIYEETLPFGIVPWTLTLAEDSTYKLSTTKPNGTAYVYTGMYEVNGSTVITGTPAEDTADIEAGFFNPDFSCAWIISDDGTMKPENAGEGGGMPAGLEGMDFSNISLQGDVEPADAIGNTYVYEEKNTEFGFTTSWELSFINESECTLFEPNQMMGDTTYNCTYTFADGQYTVTIEESDTGSMPLSSMFDAEYTCVYAVWANGDFKPANGEDNFGMNEMPGLGGSEGAENADYRAVPYASNSGSQVMDIYLPENATGSDPVIVVVHGGGFKFGSQTMEIIQPVIEEGIANVYVVASIDYRKSGEAVFPGALSDVKAAVRYLKANAAEYGIDSERVVIWGESAGAYLSLMTALTSEVDELNGDVSDNLEQSSSVAALVDFYGPVEFYTMDEEFVSMGVTDTKTSTDSSFESAFLGQAVGQDQEFTYTTWWGTYQDQLPADFSLCAWVQAGDSDTQVPYTQSENFGKKLSEVIGEGNVHFSLLEGAGHEDGLFYTEENLAQVFEFLEDAMK